MPPNKLEFELEFLTPAFIGGADPNQKAEFNFKALKGAMRYWWRQAQDWSDTQALFNKESVIFGYTRQRSSFSLHITNSSNIEYDNSGRAFQLDNQEGRSYLFYSCIGRGQRQPGRSKWIIEGSKVSFAIQYHTMDLSLIEQSLLSLWLAQTFGGLGARSRKGAGSFHLHLKNSPVPLKNPIEELFSQTAETLKETLNSALTLCSFFPLIDSNSPIKTAMATESRFKTFGPKATSNEVLDILGQTLKNQRLCFTYDGRNTEPIHQLARNLHLAGQNLTFNSVDPIAKSAFGLPILFNFKQREKDETGRLKLKRANGKTILESWQLSLQPSDHERRASPLFISIKQEPLSKQFYANLLILWNEFLQVGETIDLVKKCKDQEDKIIAHLSQPNETAIVDFIRSLP